MNGAGQALGGNGGKPSSIILHGQRRSEEFYLRQQQEHRVPVRVQVFPMRNSSGTIVGAVGIFS